MEIPTPVTSFEVVPVDWVPVSFLCLYVQVDARDGLVVNFLLGEGKIGVPSLV